MSEHNTYQEYLAAWNNRTFMFSESAGLACNNNYWVLNGEWQGIRVGDTFKGDWKGAKESIITDWKEIKYSDWSPLMRNAWYVPCDPPTESWWNSWSDVFDDDIAF